MQTLLRWAAGLLTAAAMLPAIAAQNGPPGPVRIISTFPTGSGPDVAGRLIAEKLQARWGQPVVMENKPGAAGMVAINVAKTASSTGNDLVLVDVGNLSINPLIFKRLSYDPEQDLTPVAVLYTTAFFVVVSANSPYRSYDALQAAMRKNDLRYGSNAIGGPIHLASARLESALGAQMQYVPYKETSQLYAAVATGDIDWAYGSVATSGALEQGNKLRYLAVADQRRSPIRPAVPTLQEAGGPAGLDALTWVALMAPKNTPAAMRQAINEAVNDALAQPDVKEKFAAVGFVPAPGPVEQVTELAQRDRTRYAEVLKRIPVAIDY